MKLFFRLFLLFTFYQSALGAREIILITYHPSQTEVMKSLKKVMTQRMDFPHEMIQFLEKEKPCERKEVSAAHICLKKNGEMGFPIIYTEVMKEALGVFWKDIKDDLEDN